MRNVRSGSRDIVQITNRQRKDDMMLPFGNFTEQGNRVITAATNVRTKVFKKPSNK